MTLGVLGGLGPAASCYFYDLLIRRCPASRDQEHPDVLLYSKASIPDRSAYLLEESAESPLPALTEGLVLLKRMGAQVIAVPCATAHHFYAQMQAAVKVPVINMLECTAQALRSENVETVALLATSGTYVSGAFCRTLEAAGIASLMPCAEDMRTLMEIIYSIKAGNMPVAAALEAVAGPLLARGAQKVILGCTELSLFARMGLEFPHMNPLEILADRLLAYRS